MSAAAAILAELEQLGVTLVLHDGKLHCRPPGRIPHELRDRVLRHKRELMPLITPTEVRTVPSSGCYACRGTEFWALASLANWVCARCHAPDSSRDQLTWARIDTGAQTQRPAPARSRGCDACNGRGFVGELGVRWGACGACNDRGAA
jgi:hypothetical protein